jgi:hypothetical protein
MNWEKSKAVTPLKCDFLQAFFSKEKRFFLTGGSALGLFYLDHRYSYDLDLFTREMPEWPEIDGLFHLCAREILADSEILRDSPTFRRYRLHRQGESEIVDFVLAIDQQIDETKVLFGNVRVDTLREIFVNKITTLISRCEIKDLVDLYFLEKEGLLIEDHFDEARQKDGGLDPAMISSILRTIQIKELPDYLIRPLSLGEFSLFVETLRKRMALLAYPEA